MGLGHSPTIVMDGLCCYLDAGNTKSYPGSGTAWNDLSGNGRNFTWASTPTFTSSGVSSYFTTLSNRCIGPASNSFGITNTSGYTIFLLFMQNALASSHAFCFYKDGVGSAGRAIASHCTWVNGSVFVDQGGCCNSDTRTSVAPSASTLSWNMMCFTKDSNTRKIIQNDKVLITNTAAAANIDPNSTAVDLASSAEYGGNSSAWNARLSAFIVYNRGLTDAEVVQNYTALRGRYGI